MLVNTTVIILCGGNESRWDNYLGVRKYQITIDGESLLDRTVRLVNNTYRNANIYAIFKKNVYPTIFKKYENLHLLVPAEYELFGTEADKFLSSSFLWNNSGRTIILFGDVWYSEKAIKKIFTTRRKRWVVFGRQRRSIFSKCNHGELFAWSFYDQDNESFYKELMKLHAEYYLKNVKVACGWGHYNIRSRIEFLMIKDKIVKGFAIATNFIHIDDFTEDFDYPSDYHNWVRQLELWRSSNQYYKMSMILYSKILIVIYCIHNVVFQVFRNFYSFKNK